jgi:sterol desaturase/sphingolipid hydroxylase (fatty acid hydroxylase superfamily)
MQAATRSRFAVATALHSLADRAVYPLVVGGGVALVVGSVAEGVSYWAVAPPVVLLCAAIVVVLERCRPYAAAWLEPHGDVAADRMHLTANLAVSQLAILTYGAALRARDSTMQVWPHEWPFPAQFLLGLGIIDLGLYWVHRLSHSVPWLWRLHAIHHGPRRVYWMNGQRRHVLHEAIEGAPGLVVLWLIGAPVDVVACGFATITIHLMLQHANIAYRAGILRRVFSVAELHRWHHQRLYADVQGNYGALLSVWDALFGTTLHKLGDAPPDVGMDDEPDLPLDWLGQHLWPFRRPAAREGDR